MDLGEAYAIQASLRSSAFFAAVCLKVSGSAKFQQFISDLRSTICTASRTQWSRTWDTLATMKLWRREVVSLNPDRGTIVG